MDKYRHCPSIFAMLPPIANTLRDLDMRFTWVRGGGTLIFTYIRRLGSFLGFKILNFNIFGGVQKNEYFCGMKILWIFLGAITKLDYI